MISVYSDARKLVEKAIAHRMDIDEWNIREEFLVEHFKGQKFADALQVIDKCEEKNRPDFLVGFTMEVVEMGLLPKIEKIKEKKACKTSTIKSFVRLCVSPVGESDKAYKFESGWNMMHGSNSQTFYTWIPKSQIMEVNGILYISIWIVNKNNIWNLVNREDKISR